MGAKTRELFSARRGFGPVFCSDGLADAPIRRAYLLHRSALIVLNLREFLRALFRPRLDLAVPHVFIGFCISRI
jgi:hypothetical protein